MSMTPYDSNVNRREFLKRCAVMAPAVGMLGSLYACHGHGASQGGAGKMYNKTVNFWGTGTLDIGDKWKEVDRLMGIKVQFEDNQNDPGPVIAQLRAGEANNRQISGLQGGAEKELAKAGLILPWNESAIPNLNNLWPWAQDIEYTHVDGELYGVPAVINADSIIYLPEFTGTVTSYEAVFDPKFRGRASMEDAWINSVIFAAIYLKESGQQTIGDPGNLTESELRDVMSFLSEKAREGQFRKLWSGWEDGVQLIVQKEVWVMTGWEPIVLEARRQKVDAQYAVPKEGYEGWSNDLLLHPGAKRAGVVDAAHALVNWELSGYYGATLTGLRGYVVPTDAAVSYAELHPQEFVAAEVKRTVEHVKQKFFQMKGNVYWQNVRPDNYQLYDEEWRRFRALFA